MILGKGRGGVEATSAATVRSGSECLVLSTESNLATFTVAKFTSSTPMIKPNIKVSLSCGLGCMKCIWTRKIESLQGRQRLGYVVRSNASECL